MTRNVQFLGLGMGVGAILAVTLGQPMVGTVVVLSCFVAFVLSRSLGIVPWVVLITKLALCIVVSIVVPMVFGDELIPFNPDQTFYLATADEIAVALAENPLGVDYARIVSLHNRLYSVLLGWLAFLNGHRSVLLYRLFNVFLSLVLPGLGYMLARTLSPQCRRTWVWVFWGCAVLPSVNAYAMFVLREVLIGTIVLLVLVGIWTRRYWLAVLGLPLVFYLRIQLCFLLIGGCMLYVAFRLAPRLGRYATALRGIAVLGFLWAGYFVAPLVLPLEYDYTSVWNLAGFGRFLWAFLPSFLGFDFLLATPEALEVGRSALLAARVLLFDSWLLPLLFLVAGAFYGRMGRQWRDFYLWTWALVLGYAAGYWMVYRGLMLRLWVPLYPLLVVAVTPVVVSWFSRVIHRLDCPSESVQGCGECGG